MGSESETPPATLTEMADRAPSREVVIRPRTLLTVIAVAIGAGVVVWLLLQAWQIFSWIAIAAVLAVALMPVVDALTRRGVPPSIAVTVVAALVLVAMGLVAWAVVPPLVNQTTEAVQAAPDAIDELTRGEGPFGFLERDYDIVERTREAAADTTGESLLGMTSPAVGIVRGILTLVAATLSVFFLTLFMLLEGRRWVAGTLELVPDRSRPRWERVAAGVARTIRGYVAGNLAISVVAGAVAWVTLASLGIPYAVPVAVVVAILDLVPLVGATIGTVAAGLVALTEGVVPALIVVAVFVVYQQLENHLLQPLVYGRAVSLSPLLVAVSILIATAVAGLVGALLAIPIAGSLQILVDELRTPGGTRAAADPDGSAAVPVTASAVGRAGPAG